MKYLLALTINGYLNSFTGLCSRSWIGISLNCIQSMVLGVCFFLSIYFVNTLHLEITQAGFLISLYGIGTVTGGFLGGRLIDRISPLSVSILSLILEAFAFVSLSMVHTVFWIGINLIFLGLSAYSFKTANDVWTLNQSNHNSSLRLKSVNILRAASNLGLGISGILIGIIPQNHFKFIFVFSAIALLCGSILLKKLSTNKKNKFVENKKESTQSLPHATNKMLINLILISLFFIGILIAQLSSTYPIFIQNSFPLLGTKGVCILFLLDTLIIVLFQAPLLNLLKNIPKTFLVGFGAFLMGIGFLTLTIAFSFLLAIISCIIWTTGEMIFMSLAQLACYENSERNELGKNMGTFQMVFAISTIIGPSLGSYISTLFSQSFMVFKWVWRMHFFNTLFLH